jgi:hypothetical protein
MGTVAELLAAAASGEDRHGRADLLAGRKSSDQAKSRAVRYAEFDFDLL